MKLCAMNGHYRFYELEYFFKEISRLGYKYAEIWTGPMHFYMDYQMHDDIQKLKTLEDKYGIKVVTICPEQTNPKPHNMAMKDEKGKERVFSYFKNAIDVAVKMKATKVLVTSGWAYLDEDVEDAFNRSVAMLKRVCAYAKEQGIILAIEALQEDESLIANTTAQLKRLKDAVDSDVLKICIDFGAMARVNETIDDYFATFKDDVVHVHFVDGDPIGHMALGDGTRDIKKDLDDLKRNGYDGYLTLESVNGMYYRNPSQADEKSMKTYNECK